MDINKEKIFVKKFILPHKQDRVLFELSSKKKRQQCIVRLDEYINEKYLIFQDRKFTEEGISTKIFQLYQGSNCYIIGDSIMDGKILSFKEALNNTLEDCGLNCLLCDTDVVLIKSEATVYDPYVSILVRR